MIQPRQVWELTRKDLLIFLADRRGMLLCFAVPILLASAFGAIFHRSEDQPARPRVLVVAESSDPALQRLVESLCQHPQLDASACDASLARRRLAAEDAQAVVFLPAGLGKMTPAHLTGQQARPHVEVLHPPRAHWEARLVEGVLTEVILRQSASELLAPVLGKLARLDRPFTVGRRAEGASGALSINAFSHSFCGMTLQYLLFWGMDSGLLLLRERRQGIWRRLRVAPVTWLTLLVGKAAATALIALAQILVTFTFGRVVFGVTITGSLVGFLLMALTAALLSAATGLLVAALGGNETRARSVAIVAILTLSLLGGLWLPAFLLPGWAQWLALALPTTWAARGLEGVCWQGMSLAQTWPCALALGGFSLLFLAIAWWRLTRSEGGVSWAA
ncbi:MAG: ABC transporter permease [Gemmataceae bacterium]